MRSNESEEDAEDIDAELKAAATRVICTTTKKKSLLDIIDEGSATVKYVVVVSQQAPSKSIPIAPNGSNKRKRATSRGVTTPEEPEQKRTRSTQPKDVAPARTPPTSPTPSKKKKQPVVPPQGSPRDRLRSSSKKQ